MYFEDMLSFKRESTCKCWNEWSLCGKVLTGITRQVESHIITEGNKMCQNEYKKDGQRRTCETMGNVETSGCPKMILFYSRTKPTFLTKRKKRPKEKKGMTTREVNII